MSYLFAVGITVGVLAGVWVYNSGLLGLIGFAGFLSDELAKKMSVKKGSEKE